MSKKNSVARYQRLNRPQYGRGTRRTRMGGARVWRRWLMVIALIGAVAYLGIRAWMIYTSPAGRHAETVYILIGRDTTIEQLQEQLHTKIWPNYPRTLRFLMSYHDLEHQIRPGRYAITPEMTTSDVVEVLLHGEQTPVTIRLWALRGEAELVATIDQYLLVDSTQIIRSLTDSAYLAGRGLTRAGLPALLHATAYEILWDISGEELAVLIGRHYDRFWSEERRAKARELGLTPLEVTTLASIVESESARGDEYSRIAGLYINRLRLGMRLQSDPTVIFAVGDYNIRRVGGGHLQVDSPYNTYMYAGLPPGPIRVVRPETIDAVLNAESHRYLYMCARETFDGYHNFAADYATHLRNARLYQRALTARGITTATR